MARKSIEEQIYEALVALRHRGVDGSSVLIEEPLSGKFVQVGTRQRLGMDVPCVGLTREEADRASDFYRDIGEEYPREYHAPDLEARTIRHGATFNHDFGDDAQTAAKMVVSFFQKVYRFPTDVFLVVTER